MLGIIKEGYQLPFHSLPNSVVLKNNRSALQHKVFVEEEIGKL